MSRAGATVAEALANPHNNFGLLRLVMALAVVVSHAFSVTDGRVEQEPWFQTTGFTLGEHAVKVKCRKATSAQLFSERPYSWEESNRWSGGEMWSKNMALFLGCLSYLAEKRCHVKRTKYNNRVVLADNPFGKASSDHVLDPVFFIAKELGFQLIGAHRLLG